MWISLEAFSFSKVYLLSYFLAKDLNFSGSVYLQFLESMLYIIYKKVYDQKK